MKEMKGILRLESLGIFILLIYGYYVQFPHGLSALLYWFFVPDLSFLTYFLTKKYASVFYNIAHHQGLIGIVMVLSFVMDWKFGVQLGWIFMAHSFFDRIMRYGLKYLDSFDHTHLGWIGKSKHLNQ